MGPGLGNARSPVAAARDFTSRGLQATVRLRISPRAHLKGAILKHPGEVESFEGVLGKDLSNPIPEWAEHGADSGVVDYGVAKNMNTPYPDPGEEYPHINTQLFGHIDSPRNRGVPAEQMVAPYNAPAEPSQLPLMNGFVTDYISRSPP
jgi:hypothetical protein